MNSTDIPKPSISRRGFLQLLAILGIGTATLGLKVMLESPDNKDSKFVMVNGWVLPAQYFGKY
jgi:hypothetical protein